MSNSSGDGDGNTLDTLAACFVAAMNNTSFPDNFDYLNQTFVLQDLGGAVWVGDTTEIADLANTAVTSAAIFAAQLGAAAAVAIVMLLLTNAAKRKSLMFIFNMLALVSDIIRCILQIAQLTSLLMNFIVIKLSYIDPPGINQALGISVAGTFFTCILFICIEIALIMQVRVVCAAANHIQRACITVFTVCVGLLAISFRINLMVLNMYNTLHLEDTSNDSQQKVSRAQDMANVSAIVSICIFSSIFCTKLALAIRTRRSLGLKQFGPMQIIFIMGCQTLILPAIFAILADYALAHSQVQSVVETIVAIFLPLSSIWASANTNAKLNAAGHGAVIALPELRLRNEKTVSVNTATLVDNTGGSSNKNDGLDEYERRYRSKYDLGSSSRAYIIDDDHSDLTQDVEMQRPARNTSFT